MQHRQHRTDDYPTDEWLYDGLSFEHWFDPCPLYGEEWFGDGLAMDEAGARFLPIMGRLKYGTGKAAAFPSVIVVLRRDE